MDTPFDKMLDSIEDTKVLKSILKDLMVKIQKIEQNCVLSNNGECNIIKNKINRLHQIKHGISELTERMERPYIMPNDLSIVVDTLETLANAGDCNSLIIEGKPGTGKTQLGYAQVGEKLRKGEDVSLIHVRIKEGMKASELLYSIDDVRRLSDAETKAILPEDIRQQAESWKEKLLKQAIDTDNKEYQDFKKKLNDIKDLSESGKDLGYANYVDLGELGEAIYQSQDKQMYLLIDEIEKGDEALMTGILDEIENLEFTIRETGQKIKGKKENLRIIITTNTEDSDKIPSSFRRRSLYHFQNYPDRNEMADIVNAYYKGLNKDLLDYALDVFYAYHNNDEIEKKPSTPELLSRLRILMKEYPNEIPEDIPYKHILLKYKEDQDLNVAVQSDTEYLSGSPELPNDIKKALEGNTIYYILDSSRDFKKVYAELENTGIPYKIARTEEKSVYNDDEHEWEDKIVCTQSFQVFAPGIQYLGAGAHIINDEKIRKILSPIIYKKSRIMKNIQFTSVEEKNNNYTLGEVKIDGRTCAAYTTPKDTSMFVVIDTYDSKQDLLNNGGTNDEGGER